MTVCIRTDTVTEALTYDIVSFAPNATISLAPNSTRRGSLFPGNAPVTGAIIVTVSGAGMGHDQYTATARAGGTECEASAWVADTELVCKIPRAYGSTHRVAVTAGLSLGTLTEALSFSVPVLSLAVPANSVGVGGANVSLTGSHLVNYDVSPTARIGKTACEFSIWQAETSITCRVARGMSHYIPVMITVGVQVSELSSAMSYDVASVSSISRSNHPHTGGTVTTISGHGFGSFWLSGSARIGGSACEETDWSSFTAVSCRAALGAPGSRRVVVTAGSFSTGSATEAISFDLPVLQHARFGNRPTSGQAQLNITGINLGHKVSYSGAVRIGSTSCETSHWTSETSVHCRAPAGIAASLRCC